MVDEFVVVSSNQLLERREFEELHLHRTERKELQVQQRPCVQRRRFMVQYEYVNDKWPHEIAILWTCDGKISFQSRQSVTAWHGEFKILQLTGSLIAMFDCFGQCLKSHVLHFRGVDKGRPVWVGRDYRGRSITMRQLGSSEWDESSKTWRPVDEMQNMEVSRCM